MARPRLETHAADRDPQVLARNVQRSREGLGWTRTRFCEEAGISPQTLARVERGGGCSPAVERKIATAIGTVVGRLWVPQSLPRIAVRTREDDRWYFAGHADGERYHRAQGLLDADAPLRFDPDAIQDPAERARMGRAGLVVGFVRVATAHLRAGSVIASLIEAYGRIESEIPEGRLMLFHVVRGAVRFSVGGQSNALRAGDLLHAEMAAPTWMEPDAPLAAGALPPLVLYVDPQARLNRVDE